MLATGSLFRAPLLRVPPGRTTGLWLSIILLGIAGVAGAAEPEWTNIGPPGQSIATIAIALADHPNRSPARVILLAGTPESGIFRSSDQGATWIAASNGLTDLKIRALVVSQREVVSRAPITRYETVIYARTDSGVFRSVDGGASWTAVNADLGLSPPKPYRIYALAVDPVGLVYISTRWGAFKSLDRGDSWMPISQGKGASAYALAVDARSPVTLYFNLGERLLKSVNDGEDWTDILPQPLRGWGFSGDLVLADPFSATIYVSGAIQISPFQGLFEPVQYRSRNSGESWTSFRDFGVIRDVIFLDELTTLVAAESYRGPSGDDSGLFRSTDGGATWQPTNAGFPIGQSLTVLKLASDPVSPGTVYAATTQGIFRSGPAPDLGLPRVVPKRQGLSSQVDR